MRKPSENLQKQLFELGLCSKAQLASCQKQVDRLSDGLPQFDTVWLDVLVQKRILSRFQADRLQQGRPGSLKLDQLILRDQLGSRTLLAVTPSEQPVVLQQRSASSQSERDALARLIDSLHNDRRKAPGSLAVPIRLVQHETESVELVSSVAIAFQPGWTAAELIVRGGRLPWQSVLAIGHQLLAAIEWLHAQGSCHGNINSSNVRIRPDGSAVLVGALGSRYGEGGISLSEDLSFDEVRFVAPERILNLQPVTFQSDLYSLAAVLWNMLAGRDAFLSTDPVRRVTKAGQENLPDVRTLVPDCPAAVSVALQRFSKSNPQLRPANAKEAIALLNAAGGGSRQRVKHLVRTLSDHSSPHFSKAKSTSATNSLATVAVAGLMISAFVSYGIQRGLIPSVASVTSTAANRTSTAGQLEASVSPAQPPNQSVEPDDINRILSMPQPDAGGVVVLQSGRTYHAAELNFPGVMHIETTDADLAKVLVPAGRSWHLKARQLAVSNIHILHGGDAQSIVTSSTSDSQTSTAVQVVADVVSLRSCLIESTLADHKAVCMNWSTLTGTTGTVLLKDSVLKSNGSAFSTSVVPQRCQFENTLMLVKRSVVRAILPEGSSAPWPMTLHRVTQPYGLTFADFLNPHDGGTPCRAIVTAGESVLAPSLALIQFASVGNTAALGSQVEFRLPERGNAVVVPPNVPTAVAWDNSLRSVVELSASNVQADSILPAQPLFRGTSAGNAVADATSWDGFQLVDYDGPKLTTELQGVLVKDLPVLPANGE